MITGKIVHLNGREDLAVDITICLPGIRVEGWPRVYDSIKSSVGNHSFELIIVGPYAPYDSLLQEAEISYIQDYGCPSRCLQIASLTSQGDLYTFISDDGILRENSLAKAIDNFDSDIMTMRYTEGINFSGGIHSQPNEYWTAWHHADLQKECLKNYRLAPVWMMETSKFRDLGGVDCRFEHVNVCCHDLAFRIQRAGGNVQLSPDFIMDCDWSSHKKCAVVDAYFENDKPLFDSLCDSIADPFCDRLHIDYNNWLNVPPVWPRRFNVNELNNDYRYR